MSMSMSMSSCYSSPTSRTSFSSFKSPRPAPSPPPASSHASSSSSRKVISDSCIAVKGLRLYDDDDNDNDGSEGVARHSFVYYPSRATVRKGYVGVQRERLRSWSWTRRLWLVLDDKRLCICQQEDSAATDILPLQHVRRLEQVQFRRFCLVVATSSLTWYLLFKDSTSLHSWFYDIRIRCPLMHISRPTDFRHEMHVAYDAAASEITGLPEAWIETLTSWGFGGPPPPPHVSSDDSSSFQAGIASPITEPPTSPHVASTIASSNPDVRSVMPDTPSHPPLSPAPPPAPPLVSRHRSASAAVVTSMALSTTPSFVQFRRSPNRFKDVEARDLTGVVQPINLLPTTRTENCDIWKSEWSGSFGKRMVAIQVVRLSGTISEGEQTQLSSIVLREVKALHQLRHVNVVRTRGFCRDQGPVPALVSTWLPGGRLMKYLEHHKPSVGKGARLRFITEIAAGMNYLHDFSRSIVHGDLSGAHILLSDRGKACISGFGLNPILQEMESSLWDDDPFVLMPNGPSPRWAAVEVVRMGRRHVSSFSDVFSFARTVVEVMTGKDPFYHLSNDVEVVHSVLRGVLPRRAPVFGESDGLWQFLERCWVEEPVKRPSMALALLRMEEIHCLYSETDKEEGPSTPRSSGRT